VCVEDAIDVLSKHSTVENFSEGSGNPRTQECYSYMNECAMRHANMQSGYLVSLQ
jgi:hypothetical protein